MQHHDITLVDVHCIIMFITWLHSFQLQSKMGADFFTFFSVTSIFGLQPQVITVQECRFAPNARHKFSRGFIDIFWFHLAPFRLHYHDQHAIGLEFEHSSFVLSVNTYICYCYSITLLVLTCMLVVRRYVSSINISYATSHCIT